MSMASPFCAFHGQATVMPSTMTSVHRWGTRWNRGALRSVTPCTSTRRQSVNRTRCWRIRSCASWSSATSGSCFRPKGYHRSPLAVTVPPMARYWFHSVSLTLLRFTGRQYSPLPSMMPSPVTAMLLRFEALRQGTALAALPSVAVRKSRLSGEKSINALRSKCRSMLSLSTMGPVSQMPAGTFRWPPPRLARSAMALAKARVFMVRPSPTAP